MAMNLLIGLTLMVICLTIQCIFVAIMFDFLLDFQRHKLIKTTMSGLVSLLVFVMLILLIGNMIQMALWAGLFLVMGEFGSFTTAFYYSVVNFATLGYGDIVMSEKRRLLGALEAVNGVLMIGLTTSFIFLLLNTLIKQEWDRRVKLESESTQSTPG